MIIVCGFIFVCTEINHKWTILLTMMQYIEKYSMATVMSDWFLAYIIAQNLYYNSKTKNPTEQRHCPLKS